MVIIKKTTTIPGTIEITKESYVDYMKKELMKFGCSEEQSIERAEKSYEKIVANKEKRARTKRE